MHNLVKEATGIDFKELGNDLKVAKEFTLNKIGKDLESKDKSAIEACLSIGHVLNEVILTLITLILFYYKYNFVCNHFSSLVFKIMML